MFIVHRLLSACVCAVAHQKRGSLLLNDNKSVKIFNSWNVDKNRAENKSWLL